MSDRVLALRVTAELPPQEWQITERTAEIGRLPTCTVFLPHRSVSREHAHISREGDAYLVEDLGSKNGTWLNGQPVKSPVPLNNGDTLLVGDVPLAVSLSPVQQVEEAPPEPPPSPVPALPQGVQAGPSTVMVGLEDVLQSTPQSPRPRTWDETPSTHAQPPTPLPPTPEGRPWTPPDDDDHPTVFAPLPTDLEPASVRKPEPMQRAPEPVQAAPQPEPLLLNLEPVELLQREPVAASLVRISTAADSLAAALRGLSGDLATAVWLFEHAGGEQTAQAFIDQVNAAYLNPEDNAANLQAIVDQAPTIARLLQAAMLLVRGLSPLDVDAADGRRDEAQPDATKLEPVARP